MSDPQLKQVTDTPYPLVFLRCRTIAFCAITFFNFAWIILLCIVVFMQWEFMDRPYLSILMVMIVIYSITSILLLVMLTRKFRAWLDAARFLFLLSAHFGISGAFAHYSPGFSCPQPNLEDQSVCKMLILYILISSWLLPTLITLYAGGLGVMALYRWHLLRHSESVRSFDIENDSQGLTRELHKSHMSSFIGLLPTPTPIAAQFATTQLEIPNRFTSMVTPTTIDFSSYYTSSPIRASPAATPTSTIFPRNPQPYLMPPLPQHWNSNPPPTRSRHYSVSTTLHESIPEETSSTSGDSDYEKRASTRLSKPSPSSRMPSL